MGEQDREFVWQTSLLNVKEILGNPVTCAWGTFAPCVLFAKNVQQITDGEVTFVRAALTHLLMGGCGCWCFCLPSYAAPFRAQLRKRHNLPMDPYSDIHTHRFCHPCAVCQEDRQIDARTPKGVQGPADATIDRHPPEAVKHIEAVTMQR